MFHVSIPTFDGGRVWTVVVQLMTYFGEREEHIRQYWDESKMAAVGAAGEDADEQQNDQYKDTSVHAQRATEAFEPP